MYEVELKVRAGHEPVRHALGDRDADPLGTVRQVDRYFDAPYRDFAATDEALRLRIEEPIEAANDPTATLTYKGPLLEAASKTRRESQSVVVDPEAIADILTALDFTVAATVEKRRERYTIGEFTVSLDTVEGLGEFVEIEAEVETEQAIPGVRNRAREVLRAIGLDPDEQIRRSYLGLLLDDQ